MRNPFHRLGRAHRPAVAPPATAPLDVVTGKKAAGPRWRPGRSIPIHQLGLATGRFVRVSVRHPGARQLIKVRFL